MAIEPHLADLARHASAGDAPALDQLIAELQPLVVRVTRLIVGSARGQQKTLRKTLSPIFPRTSAHYENLQQYEPGPSKSPCLELEGSAGKSGSCL